MPTPSTPTVSDVRFIELEARVVELEALYTGLVQNFTEEIKSAVTAALEDLAASNDERFKELAGKVEAAQSQLVELGEQRVQAPSGGESYLSSIKSRLRGGN
jgi:hypothetical protein